MGALFERRSRRRRWVTSLLRALVVALILPLATSGALPLWAQLAGVEGPHVCRCSVDKHDCVCAKCHPDHEETLLLSTESLTGRCGDDEIAFGGKAIRAVLPSSLDAAPLAEESVPLLPTTELVPRSRSAPPTPPPRSLSRTV